MKEYKLLITKKAEKQLQTLPLSIRERILDTMIRYSKNIVDQIDIKKLKNDDVPDLYRIRVGKYRIVFKKDDDKFIVLVIKVAHRKEVYK